MDTIGQYIRAAMRFLFDAPCELKPMGRDEYKKSAFYVFIVRGGAFIGITLLLMLLEEIVIMTAAIEWVEFFILLAAVAIFYIPYILTLYKRLLGIGFPFPNLAILLYAFGLPLLYYRLPDEFSFIDYLLELLIIAVYLILIPWPDRFVFTQEASKEDTVDN